MTQGLLLKNTAVVLFFSTLFGCGVVSDYAKQRQYEDLVLNNPGALDPKVSSSTGYITHSYRLLEKYRISHDWPIGFMVCRYSTIELPEEQQGRYWEESYSRLGDFFEYRGKTLQETKDIVNPHKAYTLSSLDKDEYVKPHKGVDGEGKPKIYGPSSVCHQYLLGTSHSLTVWLQKTSEDVWKKILDRDFPDSKLMQEKIGNNTWYGKRSELAPPLPNKVRAYERRVLPIADTGYVFEFEFGADQDSLKIPGTHERMKKVYRHLLESVKIERLSPAEESEQRRRIQGLREAIDAHEANKKR
ncbi:hypothetical protein [Sulfuriflexus sp.]|uniref:hypothetical protein n=1 Tax=Sulfuriflexus sp. TaxID=2015443 RepID=UPI0028CC0AC3|nr:hypothetical protein [Sulfuriflexus sp.]MDT8404965.1 hypothetical protein [Sulfuriflexus sp.]